jgi:hypothetical protein
MPKTHKVSKKFADDERRQVMTTCPMIWVFNTSFNNISGFIVAFSFIASQKQTSLDNY